MSFIDILFAFKALALWKQLLIMYGFVALVLTMAYVLPNLIRFYRIRKCSDKDEHFRKRLSGRTSANYRYFRITPPAKSKASLAIGVIIGWICLYATIALVYISPEFSHYFPQSTGWKVFFTLGTIVAIPLAAIICIIAGIIHKIFGDFFLPGTKKVNRALWKKLTKDE